MSYQPRRNLVRYHGILAPHAKQREKVVPSSSSSKADSGEPITTRRNYRMSWTALLARTFGLKLERCSICGGEMKGVAVITDPPSIRRYLEGTGQSASISEIAPARAPPQEAFDF
jgi:hypothetical protein